MSTEPEKDRESGGWEAIVSRYVCTAEGNDAIWREFSRLTDSIPWLEEHRDWVEANAWGFGDRAFHFLWYKLLAEDVFRRVSSPSLLEIGVYKGQVISLWALIAKHAEKPVRISGISPFRGDPAGGGLLRRAWRRVSPRHRENARVGNLTPDLDYEKCVEKILERFELARDRFKLIRGLSQDPDIQGNLVGTHFDVVYIDGDHRYEAAAADIEFYSRLVAPGGHLVVDDAAALLPGTAFFKGYESVSRAAADRIDLTRFRNVLNVGHNRVFQRYAE
jgi:SAM-dependent methyltransferase